MAGTFYSTVFLSQKLISIRGGSRTAATSKVELFVIIVNGCEYNLKLNIRVA